LDREVILASKNIDGVHGHHKFVAGQKKRNGDDIATVSARGMNEPQWPVRFVSDLYVVLLLAKVLMAQVK